MAMSTWKPATAGVLEIVAGALYLVSASIVFMAGGAVVAGLKAAGLPEQALPISVPLTASIGIPLAACGVLALLGGISALQRKRWGLAVTGAICALIPLQTLLGILSMVFLALGREEFGHETIREHTSNTAIVTEAPKGKR